MTSGRACVDADEAARLIDEVLVRFEKMEELIARDAKRSGGKVNFMQTVLMEEIYDRLSRIRRLIAESKPCPDGS